MEKIKSCLLRELDGTGSCLVSELSQKNKYTIFYSNWSRETWEQTKLLTEYKLSDSGYRVVITGNKEH